jgi:hypothetical protein
MHRPGRPHNAGSVRHSTFHEVFLLLAAGATIFSLSCSSVATAAQAPSQKATPKSVSLTLKDMPKGFTQTDAKAYSATSSQVGQYFVTFTKEKPAIAVKSTVTEFVNVRGSAPAYRQALGQAQKVPGYKNVKSVPKLGNQASTGSYKLQTGSGTITSIGVAFLQGSWVATVVETGPLGSFSQKQVIGYAQKISGRIKAGK